MLQFNWGVFWSVLAALCLFGLGFVFLLSLELESLFQGLHQVLSRLQSTLDQIKHDQEKSGWMRDVFRGGEGE
jgi:hypothetical protein